MSLSSYCQLINLPSVYICNYTSVKALQYYSGVVKYEYECDDESVADDSLERGLRDQGFRAHLVKDRNTGHVLVVAIALLPHVSVRKGPLLLSRTEVVKIFTHILARLELIFATIVFLVVYTRYNPFLFFEFFRHYYKVITIISKY